MISGAGSSSRFSTAKVPRCQPPLPAWNEYHSAATPRETANASPTATPSHLLLLQMLRTTRSSNLCGSGRVSPTMHFTELSAICISNFFALVGPILELTVDFIEGLSGMANALQKPYENNRHISDHRRYYLFGQHGWGRT